MQFSYKLFIAAATAVVASSLAAATPISGPEQKNPELPPLIKDSPSDIEIIGPASFEELKKIVEGEKERLLHKRGNIGGLYMCEGKSFQSHISIPLP